MSRCPVDDVHLLSQFHIHAWAVAGYIKRPAKPLRPCLFWVRAEISMCLLERFFRLKPASQISALWFDHEIGCLEYCPLMSCEIGGTKSLLLLLVAWKYFSAPKMDFGS